MANIIINTVCNLKCRYCFADDCKTNNKNQNMTLENFDKAVNFISQTEDYIGILGGEPTIHPNFDELIMKLIMNDRIGRVNIFTNGIEVDNHLGVFANKKVGCLINFNSEENIENKENEERVINNINELFKIKLSQDYSSLPPDFDPLSMINLGCNIYKKDQDFSILIDTLKKYKKHSLRISTVVPNSVGKKNMCSIEYFNEMKPTLFRLFKMLAEIECVPNSDCNYIPLCLYTKEEIEWLNRTFIPLAEKYKLGRFNITTHQVCHSGPMDFYPDCTVARCFGFSEYDRQHIDNYNNLNEIRNYFQRNIENVSFYLPSTTQCIDCHAHKTMQCSGGCLSYKTDKIKALREALDS